MKQIAHQKHLQSAKMTLQQQNRGTNIRRRWAKNHMKKPTNRHLSCPRSLHTVALPGPFPTRPSLRHSRSRARKIHQHRHTLARRPFTLLCADRDFAAIGLFGYWGYKMHVSGISQCPLCCCRMRGWNWFCEHEFRMVLYSVLYAVVWRLVLQGDVASIIEKIYRNHNLRSYVLKICCNLSQNN